MKVWMRDLLVAVQNISKEIKKNNERLRFIEELLRARLDR